MKIKTKKAINITLTILFIILIIILLFLLFGGKSFSKFRKQVNSNSIAQIANPIFVVNGTEDIKIDGIEDTLYNFSIKNYDGLKISDVDMDYNIEIVNNSEADLEFELLKNGRKIVLNNNKTEFMNIKGISRTTDEYELTIKYKSNPAQIEDLKGNVQIKVNSKQSEVM